MKPGVVRRVALVGLTLLFASGCAATFDLAYLAVGPSSRDLPESTAYETEPIRTERRVRFDASAGLVCEDLEHANARRTEGASTSEHPNGWLEMTWGGTLIDGIVLGIVILVRELCTDQCAPRENVYPWFSPVAASFLWGIYRSLTIHPEIVLTGSTSRSAGPAEPIAYPCPPGTLVEVVVGPERVLVPLDEVGQLVPTARTELVDLLALEGELRVRIGGVDVELVEGGLEGLRGEARARARERAASTSVTVPVPRGPTVVVPPPPPPPGGVQIEIEACVGGVGECRRR